MFAKIAAFLSFVLIFGLSENLKIYGGYRNSKRRIRISASRLDIAEDLAAAFKISKFTSSAYLSMMLKFLALRLRVFLLAPARESLCELG